MPIPILSWVYTGRWDARSSTKLKTAGQRNWVKNWVKGGPVVTENSGDI